MKTTELTTEMIQDLLSGITYAKMNINCEFHKIMEIIQENLE